MHRKATKFLSLFLSASMMAGSLYVPAVAAEPTVYQESASEETEALPEETEAEGSGAGETEELPEETEAEENGAGETEELPEETEAEENGAEELNAEETGSEEDAEQGEDQDTEDTGMGSEDAEAVQEETADPEAADGAEESAEEETAAEAAPAEDTVPESVDNAQETAATEDVLDVAEVIDANSDLTGQGYVLMNIPYADFYAAEGIDGVDIVSTATVKTYNQNMAGGSYHAGYEAADPISGAEILGVIYPVFVEDLSVLQGMTQVTDADTATITVAAGKSSTTTKEVSGKDLLFASGSYAFYILGEEPANYKTLSGSAGSYSFSAVENGAQAAQIAGADLTYGGHYTDLTLNVEADEVDDDSVVTGVVLTADGSDYVLRHVENIWRKTSLGWNWTDLDGAGLSGKTITGITYYLQDGGVYEYAVDVTVKKQLLSDIEAAFTDANAITVKGLPEDIQNPKATVSSVVGRGETPVVIADGADLVDGVVTTADAAVSGTKYNVKVVSDNYADVTMQAAFEELQRISIAGLNYFYTDTTGDLDNTLYRATVSGKGGSTTYDFAKTDFTPVGETGYAYATAPNATPLSGTLYGYGEGTATNYKEVYEKLGVSTDTDPAYDAVTSATGFSGHHAKDIPSLVAFGTVDGEKAITGLTLGRASSTVDAVTYVEASILNAAGQSLTDDQTAALAVTLKANPMTAPSDKEINVALASASLASSRYGKAEFAIVPDDSVSGYVWSEYWNSVYGATISNGETTVGAIHWIDLYGEAATSGPHYNKVEIALNNGTSKGSNEAEVSRYAAFFDGDYIKAGTYTITIYAEGYSPLTARIAVDVKLTDKTAVYNGSEVTVDEAALTGIDGDVTYTYYSDEACTKAIKSAPVNSGTYYVKAVAANLVTSNTAKLTIKKTAQSFTAKASAASVEVGKTVKVTASGAKETNKYTFASSNTKVATVNASGVVTGKAAGTVTITVKTAATANYEAGSKTVKITVNKTLKKPGNCHFTKWNNKQFTSCRISWNKVDGAEGYQTLLSWTDGSHSSQTIVKSNVLYRDCTVVSNHVSQMKVRAFFTANGKRVYGPWSNIEYITPSPAKITAQNVSKDSSLKMKISWKPVYGCNGYNVFITTNPNGKWNWNQSTSTNAMSTSAVIEKCGGKLKKNTRYYVRIVTRRKRNGVFCTVPMPASNTYTGSFIIK